MKHVFVCEEHKEFGGLGWRLESQPDFDPLSGMAVAHDILEHFPNGDESPSDEFQALGASLLIRGEGGFFVFSSPGENIGADLPEIMRHVVHKNMGLSSAPKTRPLDEYVEEWIKEAVGVLLEELKLWYDKEDAEHVKSMIPDMVGWMRIGYRRAKARYKGKLWQVRDAFRKIQEEADKALKHAEEEDKLELSVSLAGGGAEVKARLRDWEDE